MKRIGSDLWIGAVTEFLSAHGRISQTGFPQTFRPGSDGEIVKERLKYLGLSLAIFGGLTSILLDAHLPAMSFLATFLLSHRSVLNAALRTLSSGGIVQNQGVVGGSLPVKFPIHPNREH